MNKDANFLDVRLQDREYRVACPPEEQAALLTAVNYVDGKMRGLASKAKAHNPERIAVMAALNIAHELLSGKEEGFDSAEAKRRISLMEAQLDDLLKPQEPLL